MLEGCVRDKGNPEVYFIKGKRSESESERGSWSGVQKTKPILWQLSLS